MTTVFMFVVVTSLSCKGLFLFMLASVIATAVGLYTMCQLTTTKDDFCELCTQMMLKYLKQAKVTVMDLVM